MKQKGGEGKQRFKKKEGASWVKDGCLKKGGGRGCWNPLTNYDSKLDQIFCLCFYSYLIKPYNLVLSQKGEYWWLTSQEVQNVNFLHMWSKIFHILIKHLFLSLIRILDLHTILCDISMKAFMQVCVLFCGLLFFLFQEIRNMP